MGTYERTARIMNAENFGQYLKNSSQLYQLSYQELKSLVLQYPYCSNLHILLAQKSKIDNHKDWESNLNKAALYSVDRAHLHEKLQEQVLTEMQNEHFSLEEDFLELKDLSTLEEVLEKVPVEPEEKNLPAEEQVAIIQTKEEAVSTSVIEEAPPLEELEELVIPDQESEVIPNLELQEVMREKGHSPFRVLDILPDIIALAKTLDTIEVKALQKSPSKPIKNPLPKPIPKSSFSSWVQQFQPNQVNIQLGEIMESKKREDLKKERKKKRKKNKKKANTVSLIAQQSIEDRKEIASETLANLLADQGFYDKAINMYEQLILIFPEKSSFFAEKIENLKNNS